MRDEMPCRRDRRGVTLTEIMLAFFILCIATISASAVMSYGHRGTTKDFRRVEGLEILTDRMNRLCAMSFKAADTYLTLAGAASYTFNDPIEGIPFGTIEMPVSKNKFQVSTTLTRQLIIFPTMMQLILPNPGYLASDVRTWQMQDTGEIRFDGLTGAGHNPYKVLKVLVHVQPLGNTPPELAVDAISFIADLDV